MKNIILILIIVLISACNYEKPQTQNNNDPEISNANGIRQIHNLIPELEKSLNSENLNTPESLKEYYSMLLAIDELSSKINIPNTLDIGEIEEDFEDHKAKALSAIYLVKPFSIESITNIFGNVLYIFNIIEFLFNGTTDDLLKDLALLLRHSKHSEPRPIIIGSGKDNSRVKLTSELFGQELLHEVNVFSKQFNEKDEKDNVSGTSALVSAVVKILMLSGDILHDRFDGILKSNKTELKLSKELLTDYDHDKYAFKLPHEINIRLDGRLKISSDETPSTLADKVAVMKGLLAFFLATTPDKPVSNQFDNKAGKLPADIRLLAVALFNVIAKDLQAEHVIDLKKEVAVNDTIVTIDRFVGIISNPKSLNPFENSIGINDLADFSELILSIENLLKLQDFKDNNLLSQESIDSTNKTLQDLKFLLGFIFISKFQDVKSGLFKRSYRPQDDQKSEELANLSSSLKVDKILFALENSIGGTIFGASASLNLKNIELQCETLEEKYSILNELNGLNYFYDNKSLNELIIKEFNQ